MKKSKFETVNITPKDKQALRDIAEQEHRSMCGQIAYWIEQHILQQLEKQKESA